MTPDEIRKEEMGYRYPDISIFLMLREVAAQLSEMNGYAAQISEELQTIRNKIG